jgi:hypothetical protein
MWTADTMLLLLLLRLAWDTLFAWRPAEAGPLCVSGSSVFALN